MHHICVFPKDEISAVLQRTSSLYEVMFEQCQYQQEDVCVKCSCRQLLLSRDLTCLSACVMPSEVSLSVK